MAATPGPTKSLQRVPSGLIPLIISGTDASTALLTGIAQSGDANYQCDIWGYDLNTNGVTDLDFIDSVTGLSLTGILGFGASSGPMNQNYPLPSGDPRVDYAYPRATGGAGSLITMTNSGSGVRVSGTIWVNIRPKG